MGSVVVRAMARPQPGLVAVVVLLVVVEMAAAAHDVNGGIRRA